MRIGINEVILYARSAGTRQRDLNVLPELLKQIEAEHWEARVYVAQELNSEILGRLVGDTNHPWVVRTPIPAVPTYKRILKGIRYWSRQVRWDRLDLFHTSYYPVPRLPIPTVLTVNDLRFMHAPETYRASRRLFLRLTVPLSLRRASRIITISRDTREDVVRYFDVPRDKVDVVYIAADPRFQPVTSRTSLDRVAAKYNLPERFILFVGHLEPRKNLTRLVEAYSRLRNDDQIAHRLVILGKRAFGVEPLLQHLRNSRFEDDIVFTGYVADSDMPAIYTLADLLAFPSLHEGFGIPVIEAMACGTPVVTSDVAALPEIAGDAAQLCDPYSVESIASAIIEVLGNEVRYESLVQKGLKRVLDFSADNSASAILESYRNTLIRERECPESGSGP